MKPAFVLTAFAAFAVVSAPVVAQEQAQNDGTARSRVKPARLIEFTGDREFLKESSRLRVWRGEVGYTLEVDAAGQPLFAEPGPLPVPAALANSTSTEVWQWQHHDHYFRGLSAAVTVPADSAPLRVILLLDSTPHMHFFSAVQRWFWMALVLSALFSAVALPLVAGWLLKLV